MLEEMDGGTEEITIHDGCSEAAPARGEKIIEK